MVTVMCATPAELSGQDEVDEVDDALNTYQVEIRMPASRDKRVLIESSKVCGFRMRSNTRNVMKICSFTCTG